MKFGFTRKVVFGKNSPVTRISPVERMVLETSTNASLPSPKNCSRGLLTIAENAIPYITSTTLLPTRRVEINISS
jgi:hypothetical protein